MKKRSVFLLFFLYLLITATAQPLHQIRGTVIDKASRKPLEFINVVIAGSGMGSVTDSVGHFTIQAVPPGIYRLQASAVGYKTTLTSEYILSTKNLNIDIEMEENPTELEGVTIGKSGRPAHYRGTGNRKKSGSQPGHFTCSTVISGRSILARRIPQRPDCTWRFSIRKPILSGWSRNTEYQPFQYARSIRRSRRYH